MSIVFTQALSDQGTLQKMTETVNRIVRVGKTRGHLSTRLPRTKLEVNTALAMYRGLGKRTLTLTYEGI